MNPADQYHVGIIVEDFAGALTWTSQVYGYRWCEPVDTRTTVLLPDGEREIRMHLTYSMDEPRLEIIEAVPGTLWEPADSGLHHIGFWSDHVEADIEQLVAAGMTLDAKGLFPDGSTMWAYCGAPSRPRTELVNSALRPSLTEWFTRGTR